ncbi:hypothetical protein M0813_12525 [Anaeramoeba flamelloides]|uniref:Uncharacterized protein n=1 Tax=Anaeramoeba flamelloides TaxID=1746091 RepID=A0ABQ8ZCB9_9EUKA|nr:hypothetical protein M0813_12525 [Anaeramoeba flamelloides]
MLLLCTALLFGSFSMAFGGSIAVNDICDGIHKQDTKMYNHFMTSMDSQEINTAQTKVESYQTTQLEKLNNITTPDVFFVETIGNCNTSAYGNNKNTLQIYINEIILTEHMANYSKNELDKTEIESLFSEPIICEDLVPAMESLVSTYMSLAIIFFLMTIGILLLFKVHSDEDNFFKNDVWSEHKELKRLGETESSETSADTDTYSTTTLSGYDTSDEEINAVLNKNKKKKKPEGEASEAGEYSDEFSGKKNTKKKNHYDKMSEYDNTSGNGDRTQQTTSNSDLNFDNQEKTESMSNSELGSVSDLGSRSGSGSTLGSVSRSGSGSDLDRDKKTNSNTDINLNSEENEKIKLDLERVLASDSSSNNEEQKQRSLSNSNSEKNEDIKSDSDLNFDNEEKIESMSNSERDFVSDLGSRSRSGSGLSSGSDSDLGGEGGINTNTDINLSSEENEKSKSDSETRSSSSSSSGSGSGSEKNEKSTSNSEQSNETDLEENKKDMSSDDFNTYNYSSD